MDLIHLTVDIETIPSGDMEYIKEEDLPKTFTRPEDIVNPKGCKDVNAEVKVPASVSKLGEEAINKYVNDEVESRIAHNEKLINQLRTEAQIKINEEVHKRSKEEFLKRSFNPMKNKIICLSFQIWGEKPIIVFSHDEEELINEFADKIIAIKKDMGFMNFLWIGHNLGFDLSSIYLKAIKYDRKDLILLMPKDKYDKIHFFDTVAAMTPFGMDYIKLKDACKYFGLDEKTEDMDGAEVYPTYLNENYDKIKAYNANDVAITYQLFNKLYVERKTYKNE